VLFHHSTGNLKADQQVMEQVTVAAETLSTSVGAPEKIDNLLFAAITQKRPVYIACYKEVWAEPCPQPSAKQLQPLVIKSEPAALANAVDNAWATITAKDANNKPLVQNPLIFAGVEVLRFGLSGLLQQLIDASGFLYTTTTLGKTVLDEKGDKFIGTYSDAASIQSVTDTVQKSDCIITLGTIITDDYLWFIENKYAQMILATNEATRVGYFTYNGVTMKDFMEALLARFKQDKNYPLKVKAPAQPVYPKPWIDNSDPKYNNKPDIITYNRFFQHAMHFLQDNNLMKETVFTLGVSSSLYVSTNAYGLWQNSFVNSAAWQCIGFETGAASGAQLGSGKRAWCIAGDGGFMMVCQSLSTLARNNLDAVIFVISNGVYAIEQVYVDLASFAPAGKFDSFDILPKWDYMALAKAFGANAYRATTIEELKSVLQQLKKRTSKPTFVEVVIPEKDLPEQMRRLGIE
jgi:indolepyruvate decarboxylase